MPPPSCLQDRGASLHLIPLAPAYLAHFESGWGRRTSPKISGPLPRAAETPASRSWYAAEYAQPSLRPTPPAARRPAPVKSFACPHCRRVWAGIMPSAIRVCGAKRWLFFFCAPAFPRRSTRIASLSPRLCTRIASVSPRLCTRIASLYRRRTDLFRRW